MALFRTVGCCAAAIAIGALAALVFFVEVGIFIGLFIAFAALMLSCCLPSNNPETRAAIAEMGEVSQMRHDLLDYYSKEEARRLNDLRRESLSCGFRHDYQARMSEIFRWRRENHRRVSEMNNEEVRREYAKIVGFSEF